MLTARIDGIGRLVGLDSGGDDCVCKPFGPRAVMARVKAQLRMCKARSRRRQTPGQSAIDRLRIAWHGHWLDLTRQTFRFFRLLLD